MMNTEETALTDSYLAQLQEEARRLPPDQAAEMVADIREHIAAATAGDAGEAHVREVLERLGSPQDVVSEALGGAPSAPTAPPLAPSPYTEAFAAAKRTATPSATWSGRETTAIACLIAAEVAVIVVPVAGIAWIVGLVALLTSGVWTSREKVLGGLTLGLGFPLAVITAVVGLFSAQLSWFRSTVHQICLTNNAGTSDPSFPLGTFNNVPQPAICHSSTSSSHTAIIVLAVLCAVLLIAQIIATRWLLQARRRTPAA